MAVPSIVAVASIAARAWLLLHRPLWFDEVFTVWAARLSPRNLVAVLEKDSGPPLFYLLEKSFVLGGERLFSSDLAARLLSFAATLALSLWKTGVARYHSTGT